MRLTSSTRLSVRRLLTIAIVVVGWAVSATAQEPLPPTPTPHPLGQLRLGTVSFTPTFRISNVGLDTNVFDVSGVERRPADFTATFEPGVETRLATNRLDARAWTRAAFVYYRKYATEQAVNPTIDLQVDDRLSSHLALYAKGSYGYGKERIGLEIDSRPRTFSQATTAGLRLGGRKLKIDLHGLYNKVAFDRNARFLDVDLSHNMDHRTTGGGASVDYALSPYTTLTAGVDEAFDRFGFAPDRDMNSFSTFAGVRFNPRAVISGDAALGYRRSDPQSPRTPSFSGFTPRAGLTYKLSDILSVGAGGERGLDNSFYGDRPYYVFTLYEGSVRLAIFRHFDIGGSLQYTTLEYRRFLDAAASLAEPRDIIRMETVNVGVPINRRFRVGCFVQRWRRLSAERPYETTRVGLEMTAGPATLSPRGIFLSGPGR